MPEAADKRIFLSCVTPEFRSCRELITADLRRAGADVKVQENFAVVGGTLLEKLHDYIRKSARGGVKGGPVFH